MCGSSKSKQKNDKDRACRAHYDDYTSRRFDRYRIEAELFNLIDDESYHQSTDDDDDVAWDDVFSFDRGYNRDCSNYSHNTDLPTKRNQDCSHVRNLRCHKRNHMNTNTSVNEGNEEEPQPSKQRGLSDMFHSSYNCSFSFLNDVHLDGDDDSLDPLLISLDFESDAFDESVKSFSSQISYDDSTVASSSSVGEGLSIANESQYFRKGGRSLSRSSVNSLFHSPRSTRSIFMLDDGTHTGLSIANEKLFIADEGRQVSGSTYDSSLNSPTKSIQSTFVCNEETEVSESETVIGYSKGSSRFTTDSPKILELREKKRLMERSHEKKYSKFPALIEMYISAPIVY